MCFWRDLVVLDLEDHQTVFRTLWRVHRSWSFAIPTEFRTPVISRDRIECWQCPAWLQSVPELSSFDAPFVPLFVTPSGRQATSMVRRKDFRWIPIDALRKEFYGIVHIKGPKTRRMTGRAAQQRVLLECPGIWQLINTMKASIPGSQTRYTNLGKFTPAQHFACFQRQLRSLGVSHQHHTLHDINITRSTGSEAMALPIIGFSIATYHNYDAEVGGPLKGPLTDTFKKARSNFIKTVSPRKLRTVSALSQISHLVSLQNKTAKGPATNPYSHHIATERTEEFTPFCAAASSNGALPTPSCLSERAVTLARIM